MPYKLYAQTHASPPLLLGESETLDGITPIFAEELDENNFEGTDIYVEGPDGEHYVETGLAVYSGEAGPFVPAEDPRSFFNDIYPKGCLAFCERCGIRFEGTDSLEQLSVHHVQFH